MLQQHILISDNDWSEIYAHYLNTAPFNLLSASSVHEIKRWSSSIDTSLDALMIPPTTTAITCEKKDPNGLVFGTQDGQLYSLKHHPKSKYPKVNTAPVQIKYQEQDTSYFILSMGELGPANSSKGKLQKIKEGEVDNLLEGLNRPVHLALEDLNDDSNQDYIISSFGSTNDSIHTGGLSIFSGLNDTLEEYVIVSYTGATKSIVYDYNNDGRKDIISLFSQGDERIILFENEGNFEFKEHVLLRFHPLYGTLDFILEDMDRDGLKDIVVVNGDNADYSQIYKPYHGLRIFKNIAPLQYEEVYFMHINGASKLEVANLNNDNNYDILVLSTYPDHFTKPYEAVTILINKGELNYERHYLDEKSKGNWLLCALCLKEDKREVQVYLSSNNSIIRRAPPQLELEWKKNPHTLIKYQWSK